MRPNDWSLLTGDQWLAMALILLASAALMSFLEWVSKPRANKWSDWKRARK